jgi:hypothetical protein
MQALDETVDLLGDRVEVEACAVRGGDAEPGHQRLTAVVSGADRDVKTISRVDVALMKARTFSREPSKRSVARSASR